jgi:hypothetical protein
MPNQPMISSETFPSCLKIPNLSEGSNLILGRAQAYNCDWMQLQMFMVNVASKEVLVCAPPESTSGQTMAWSQTPSNPVPAPTFRPSYEF